MVLHKRIIDSRDICPKCGSVLWYAIKKGGGWRYFCPNCDYIIESKTLESEHPEFLDEKCPKCGAPLVKRKNKKGKVLVACSTFPECRYVEGHPDTAQTIKVIKKCPSCKDGNLVVRKGWDKINKHVRKFLGCTNYPKCKYIEEISESDKKTK